MEEPFPCEFIEGMEAARNIIRSVHGSDVENDRSYALYLNKCPLEDWHRDRACRMSQFISDESNKYYTAQNALESGESDNKSEVEEMKRAYFSALSDFYVPYEKEAGLRISDFQEVFQEIYKSVKKVWDTFHHTANQVEEAFESANNAIHSLNNSHDSVDIYVIDDTDFIIENIKTKQLYPALLPLYEKFHEIYAKHYLKCTE